MISVILPVYNVEKYLVECLESLLNQNYKNFELIAINDGSTDESLSILNAYRDKFFNCEIITQENKGLSEARNAGLPFVRGKYIYFLDSDDYILPNTFENLVALAEENQLDLIKFDAEPFVEVEGKFNMSNYDTSSVLKEGVLYSRDEYVKSVQKRFMPPVWLYFIKSEIMKNNDLTFKKDLLHEDELFTVQLLKECNRIMYDSNRYFQRRYRANSIMTGSLNSNQKSFDSKVEIIRLFSEFQKSEDSSKGFFKFLQSRKNTLYTTLFFYKLDKSKNPNKLLGSYNVKIDARTFLRELKKRVNI